VKAFLNKYVGPLGSDSRISKFHTKIHKAILNVYFKSGFTWKKVYEVVSTVANLAYQVQQVSEAQENIRTSIPETMREFLPKNIVIEVDKDGTIQKITDRFENQYETLDLKISRQHKLIRNYNKIVKKVKKDLRSPDERIRMAALVTSIIMETGIRPGQEKNKATVTVDGDRVEVETFGATTLGPKHVSFLKDFAELKFVGKKGTVNTASLSNRDAIKVLKDFVKSAKDGKAKYIFTTEDGEKFKYSHLKTYFNHTVFKSLKITDFRKLKATETVLKMLHEEQEDLYRRILKFSDLAKGQVEERIAQEVADTLNTAYTRAQEALSHEDVATTIGAYVNPEVLLEFLSKGRVDKDIKKAVLEGKKKLVFNTDAFLEKAQEFSSRKMVASLREKCASTSLQTLLDDLEEDLGA
jgi:hypothetical protein